MISDAILATVAFLIVVTAGARIHARLGQRPPMAVKRCEPALDEYDTQPIRRSVLDTARARIVPHMPLPEENNVELYIRITERNHGNARWN